MHEGFEAGEAHLGLELGDGAGLVAFGVAGDVGDVIGRGPAAAADDVDQAICQPRFNLAGHIMRALVVFAHGVGQACVGIGRDPAFGDVGKFGDVGPHQLGTKRAIEPDREGP